MSIQVLGSGCPTCAKLQQAVQATIKQMGWSDQVEYLTGADGMKKIVELGVMSSPVLVVDGQVAMVGFTSEIDLIKTAILKIRNK